MHFTIQPQLSFTGLLIALAANNPDMFRKYSFSAPSADWYRFVDENNTNGRVGAIIILEGVADPVNGHDGWIGVWQMSVDGSQGGPPANQIQQQFLSRGGCVDNARVSFDPSSTGHCAIDFHFTNSQTVNVSIMQQPILNPISVPASGVGGGLGNSQSLDANAGGIRITGDIYAATGLGQFEYTKTGAFQLVSYGEDDTITDPNHNYIGAIGDLLRTRGSGTNPIWIKTTGSNSSPTNTGWVPLALSSTYIPS